VKWALTLCKVVKDAIPTRISKELCYSKEDLSSFEGYKWAVMRIDNNHWKYIQEEKNKAHMACTLQNYLPQTPWIELTRGIADERSIHLEWGQKDRSRASRSGGIHQLAEHPVLPRTSTLGPDSRLITIEYTHWITLGLCLCYGQSSYLGQSCPRQFRRSSMVVWAWAAVINNTGTDEEETKNKVVVTLLPRGLTA